MHLGWVDFDFGYSSSVLYRLIFSLVVAARPRRGDCLVARPPLAPTVSPIWLRANSADGNLAELAGQLGGESKI